MRSGGGCLLEQAMDPRLCGGDNRPYEDRTSFRAADYDRRAVMGKRIAVVGVGAVGGYTGAHMVRAGEDLTFIDSGRRMSRK